MRGGISLGCASGFNGDFFHSISEHFRSSVVTPCSSWIRVPDVRCVKVSWDFASTVDTCVLKSMSKLSYAYAARSVWPIVHSVPWVSSDNEWIASCTAWRDIVIPICASVSITFYGVLQECKKIPNTDSSALHFWFVPCIRMLIMTTFFCNRIYLCQMFSYDSTAHTHNGHQSFTTFSHTARILWIVWIWCMLDVDIIYYDIIWFFFNISHNLVIINAGAVRSCLCESLCLSLVSQKHQPQKIP